MTSAIPVNKTFRIILIVALLLGGLSLRAQYFSLGQEPASVKWQVLRSGHFRIIYPRGMDHTASYLSGALEYSRKATVRSLGADPRPISLVLHNYSTYSNAFVPYAPRRMEFLTTPPQDTYPQPWLDQLVLHEYRHAGHYRKMEQGFTRFLYYPFGEQVIPVMLGAFVPLWFIEGDATVAETAMSRSGRGRLPSFGMTLRAQFLEKGPYHYDKATHGSYRDFVPDRYVLGYHLVGMTRAIYGTDAWNTALDNVARYPFMLVPFSAGLAKTTGKGKVKLYRYITDTLQSAWREQELLTVTTGHTRITKVPAEYTDYTNPVVLNDSTLAALKRPIDDIPKIVAIDIVSGDEEELALPGVMPFYEILTGNEEALYWGERIPDLRWQMRDHAVIVRDRQGDRKSKRLTGKTRYFSPALSSDGKRLAVVETDEKNISSLLILDAGDGSELKRLATKTDEQFITPRWSDDGSAMAVIILNREGKRLSLIDTRSGKERVLIPASFNELSYPVFLGDLVLFSAAYSGIDNLYVIDTVTRQISQVTSSRFGATQASVSGNGKTIYYADYSSEGHRIVSTSVDPGRWKPLDEVRDLSIPLAEVLSAQERFVFDRDSVVRNTRTPKRYRKGLHLFNPHSWAPVSLNVDNVDNVMLNPGASVFSQDLLSSSFASVRYEYNMNEKTNRIFFDYTYAGMFPVFDIGVDHGNRKTGYTDDEGNEYELSWLETNLRGRVSVPLNLSRRHYYNSVQPSVQFDHTILTMADNMPASFRYDRISSLRYGLFAYRQIKRSHRDLLPRWGQAVDLNYRHSLPGTSIGSSIIALEGFLYFPGIIRHHGLRIYAAYQVRKGDYNFQGLISIPRGYSHLDTDHMVSLKGDYVFPVFYPDWRIGPLLYVKRFKGRFFFDHAFDTQDPSSVYFKSFGGDLTTDLHIFSFLFPFETGVRVIQTPGSGETHWQFLIRINTGAVY